MSKPIKILVIRLSSMGDIVLTTPIVRCLNKQLNTEIHFLTKKEYVCLLDNNPYIHQIHVYNKDYSNLKNIRFDKIIDLQNNFKSFKLKFFLGVKSVSFKKLNLERWLLIHFNINFMPNKHIVDRYFDTVLNLGVSNDHKSVDYFIKKEKPKIYKFKNKYLCWSLSASHENKKLSTKQIIETINKIQEKIDVVFIGGQKENNQAEEIIKLNTNLKNKDVYNFCGLSINESAVIIKDCKLFFTNDTGMMHIASSFNKCMISFWGCTKPVLGFSPYVNENSKMLISSSRKNPCSKHGKSCKKSKSCIKSISSEEIYNAYLSFIE